MRKFSEQYARRSRTYFCMDKGVTSVVIKRIHPLAFRLIWQLKKLRILVLEFDASLVKGLAEHKDTLDAPLCPCRHYDDKAAEVGQGFWNCSCIPMRERKECQCMLFLTPDNDLAGNDQSITLEEIKETTANM